MSEMMDLYLKDGIKAGKVIERHDVRPLGCYILYVLAILENQDGRFLITKRAEDKQWAAGQWEIPGGGVRAGEGSEQALRREVFEETSLTLDCNQSLTPVYHYLNTDEEHHDNYQVDIYHLRLNLNLSDIKIAHREVTDVRLATKEEICRLNAQGQFLHYQRIQEALQHEQESK